ncbi:MAG: M23 family metallopeptidase [Calothrix sp. C42_A2020_038]|nr:M23 family metallopeptidase [Calothrix sp. C42_A2020_038]
MTQRKNARNLRSSWHRSLGAQSLCWLSSISFMSSGLVLAQTESAIDNIVPTTENTQKPKESAPKVTIERNPSPSKESSAANEFSSRHSRLRERLKKNDAQQASESAPKIRRSSQTSEAIQRLRQARKTNQNEPTTEIPPIRNLRPKVADSPRNEAVPEARVRKNPVEATQLKEPNRENTAQIPSRLPEVLRNSKPVNTAEQLKDYNNAYIDPTDYSAGNTGKYQSPDTVILTERSSGCRSVLVRGAVNDSCVKAPVTASLRERTTANRDNDSERAVKPNWIRKSQNINVATTSNTTKRTATTENQASWRRIAAKRSVVDNLNGNVVDVTRNIPRTLLAAHSKVANLAERKVALTAPTVAISSSKNTYHPNRFIPSPSNFAAGLPLAAKPDGGALPPPVNAVNVVPRDSKVAYNIPLESTLPRVAYSGSTIAYNPNGLIFPLSVPASITSIFGWRRHPITGDVRFHSGTDLGAAMGTPVVAAFTGQVEVADFIGGYGLTAVLNHNGAVQTLYGHMSQLFVQPGQWVQQGTVIGLVGSTGNSTGPHLHFEVRRLTPEGWVATDPGVYLQYALSQLRQSIQTAQVPEQPN